MQRFALTLALVTVSAYGNLKQDSIKFWNHLGREHLTQKFKWKKPTDTGPKNVIFFLGDGMGLSMVTAGRVINAQKRDEPYLNGKWAFEKFDFSGLLKTSSYDFHTTDSAAGAMALFSGHKVEQNSLGRKPGYGESCEKGEEAYINDGIAELAIAKGMDVGIVTTTQLTDATPAANYAKGVHRRMEHNNSPMIRNTSCIDSAQQLLNYPANQFKVIMGGGHKYFIPVESGGERTDGRNIEKEWIDLDDRRKLLRSRDGLRNYEPKIDEKVLGVFHDAAFDFHLDVKGNATRRQPRLVEMATKALEILKASDNDNGFYLMIEGGHIDLAEHKNKMHLATEELVEFSHTIETIRGLVGEDTLIVVTADHAHALTLPGYVHKTKDIMAAEVETSLEDNDGLPVPNLFFAVGPGSVTPRNYTEKAMADPHFMQPAAFHTAKGAHGGEDVGIWTHGPYSWLFSGSMENTQVAYTIKFLLCLDGHETGLCDLTEGRLQYPGTRDRDGYFLALVMLSITTTLSSVVSVVLFFLLCRMRNGGLSRIDTTEMKLTP